MDLETGERRGRRGGLEKGFGERACQGVKGEEPGRPRDEGEGEKRRVTLSQGFFVVVIFLVGEIDRMGRVV